MFFVNAIKADSEILLHPRQLFPHIQLHLENRHLRALLKTKPKQTRYRILRWVYLNDNCPYLCLPPLAQKPALLRHNAWMLMHVWCQEYCPILYTIFHYTCPHVWKQKQTRQENMIGSLPLSIIYLFFSSYVHSFLLVFITILRNRIAMDPSIINIRYQ